MNVVEYNGRKKVLIFLDHDFTIRHFIHSGVLKNLEDEFDVSYVFNIDNSTQKRHINSDIFSLDLPRVLTTEIPRKRMGSWHRLYAVTVLHKQRGTSNFTSRRYQLTQIDGRLRTTYHLILSLPGIYQIFRWRFVKKQGLFEPLHQLLVEERAGRNRPFRRC